MKSFNQISQSAVYVEDETSVSLTVCGGSYGGGSEVLVLQRRFSNIIVQDTEVSPTIEAGTGGGGNNLPMILDELSNKYRTADGQFASGKLLRTGRIQRYVGDTECIGTEKK